mgnify:CR=1 FL=1
MVTPLIFSLFQLGKEKEPLSVTKKFLGDFLPDEIDLPGGKCTEISFYLLDCFNIGEYQGC